MRTMDIEPLHAQLAALRAEWEALPERRYHALLQGDGTALQACEVRQVQIPYEVVEACRLTVAALLQACEAQARALEEEQESLAAQLRAIEPEVRGLWERIRPIQERYLALRMPSHDAPIFTIQVGSLQGEPNPTSPLVVLHQTEMVRIKQAQALLDQLARGIAGGDEQAIRTALDILQHRAPYPLDRVLQIRPPQPAFVPVPVERIEWTAPEPEKPRARVKRREVVERAPDKTDTASAPAAAAAIAAGR